MRRTLVGAAAVALLCAGCSGGSDTVEITTTDNAGQPTVITQEVTQAPEETTSEEPIPAPVALAEHSFDVPGGTRIALDLPEDWTVEPLGAAERPDPPVADALPPEQWCLVPPSAPPAIDGCGGILLAAGPDWLPGGEGTAYSLRQVEGWRSTSGPLTCPSTEEGEPADATLATATPDEVEADAGDSDGDDAAQTDTPEEATESPTVDPSEVDILVTANEGLPLTSVQTEVAGRAVTYETWRAACSLSEDVVLTPQVWRDAELGVLLRDDLGLPESAVIVESLRGA